MIFIIISLIFIPFFSYHHNSFSITGDIIQFVDAVIDSSRYYVIRLKDPNSTRTTLIGIGFRDRETSFDFKNILNEYVRYIDRMAQAEKLSNEAGGTGTESIKV